MSGDRLTPETIKQRHRAAVLKSETFKPHGISEQTAQDYLDTNEGTLYLRRLAEADVRITPTDLRTRALQQLMSGRDLPRVVTIGPGDPLVKAVPRGTLPTPYTPFFGQRSEFEKPLSEGRAINDAFGLPIKSEA
ncbi:MAG TPA: hypothetical protein VF264_00360, partial [Rhodanobacteraceae bacterium]